MTHTSSADWKAAADLLAAAACSESIDEMAGYVIRHVRTLLRGDVAVWDNYKDPMQPISFEIEPDIRYAIKPLRESFVYHFPNHPIIPLRETLLTKGGTFHLSECVSTRRFLNSGLWSDVYRHLGAKFQLGFLGRVSSNEFYSLGVNRVSRDFGPRERELAAFLQSRLTRIAHVISRRIAFRAFKLPTSGRLPLTNREREVHFWLAQGKSNLEIGILMGISARTVEKHCEHLYSKLGVETRLGAALI